MSNVKNAIEWHCLNCSAYGEGEYTIIHLCPEDVARLENYDE